VESEPGKGTTFNVYFPITEKDEKIQEESDEHFPQETSESFLLMTSR